LILGFEKPPTSDNNAEKLVAADREFDGNCDYLQDNQADK
jgi:hypothetical protein